MILAKATMPASLVTAIGVPACIAHPACLILVNETLPLWFSNIPAGGPKTRKERIHDQ